MHQPQCFLSTLFASLTFLLGPSALAQVQPGVPVHPNHKRPFVRPFPRPNLNSSSESSSSVLAATSPEVGPNVRVNAPQEPFPMGLLGRSETTIAATADGQFLLAGFNDAQGFCGPPFRAHCKPENPPGLSGFSFSLDGGLNWTDGGAPNPRLFDRVFTRGDPWMDRGGSDDATFYYSNIAVDAVTGTSLGVSIHRGHFSGSGFAFEDVHTVNSSNPNDMYDKDAVAAAKGGSGLAVVSLSNFIEVCGIPAFGFGQITVWHTQDSGNSWQGPVIVSPDMTFITDPSNPDCGLTGTIQQGAVPAIGPNGEVYVTWLQGPTFTGPKGSVESTNANIEVARSLDGGMTFGAPVRIATTNVSFLRTSPAGYNRFSRLDSPRIAVATAGSKAGRVYVTFTSETSPAPIPGTVPCPSGLAAGSACIGQDSLSEEGFISFSDDKGATWSTPTRFAPAVPANGVKRMWPVPTVGPSGDVDVIFYQSHEASTSECVVNVEFSGVFRVGPANSLVNTFSVRSTDGGSTFSAPVLVSNATSNWCTTASDIFPNFGDYISSFTIGNQIFPVWADGRNGVPDTFFAPVF
jgi:hypothetical protein